MICPCRPAEADSGYTESAVGGQDARVRVLDTGSAPGNATAVSTIVYTYPPGGRAPSAAIGRDFTTMYVAWLTGRDTFHLAGHRIGAGVQGTLFSRSMRGEMISRAGGQVLVWDPWVSLYLVDPVTGKATRLRTVWTNAWESSGKTATTHTRTGPHTTGACKGDSRDRPRTRDELGTSQGADQHEPRLTWVFAAERVTVAEPAQLSGSLFGSARPHARGRADHCAPATPPSPARR
jgi:hypothetical protein